MPTNPRLEATDIAVPSRGEDDDIHSLKLGFSAGGYTGDKVVINAVVNAQVWHQRLCHLSKLQPSSSVGLARAFFLRGSHTTEVKVFPCTCACACAKPASAPAAPQATATGTIHYDIQQLRKLGSHVGLGIAYQRDNIVFNTEHAFATASTQASGVGERRKRVLHL